MLFQYESCRPAECVEVAREGQQCLVGMGCQGAYCCRAPGTCLAKELVKPRAQAIAHMTANLCTAQGLLDLCAERLSGLNPLQVLKTTQSGYAGFLHDEFTSLPDCTDRIVATNITATWK
jgi:hypothetical protein